MDTEKPKQIKLPNRYRENNYLEEVKENEYVLHCQFDYCRAGFDPKTPYSYEFVDPSGGPFMSIGDTQIIPGKTLDQITHKSGIGFVLIFKNNMEYDDKRNI